MSPQTSHTSSAILFLQFALHAGGRIVAAGLQLLATLLVARAVSLAEFGAFALTLSVIAFLQALFDFGLTTHIVKQRVQGSPRAFVFLRIGLASSAWAGVALASASAVVLIAAYFVSFADEYLSLLPLAVWAGIDRWTDVRMGVSIADEKAHQFSAVLILRRLGNVAIFLLLASFGLEALQAFAWGSLASSVAATRLVARFVQIPGVRLTPARVSMVLASARPYWAVATGSQLKNLDTLLVTGISGALAGGSYGAASRASSPLSILTASLGSVLLPRATRGGRADHSCQMQAAGLLWVLVSVIYASVAAVVPIVVPQLLGQEYVPAITPLQIAVLGLIGGGAASLLNSLLQGWGHQKAVGKVTWIASVLTLAFVAIGAVISSAVGAAIGLASGLTTQALLLSAVLLYVHRDGRL